MIVMKFGGTSVADATAIKRVKEIIKSRLSRKPIVIVSAIDDVTDLLVEVGMSAARRDRTRVFDFILQILKKHKQIILDIGLPQNSFVKTVVLNEENELKRIADAVMQAGHMPRHLSDELLSQGEYLSAHIVSAFLDFSGIPSKMVDARELIITDSQFGKAQPNKSESATEAKKRMLPLIKGGIVPVMQGFVGRDALGRTTTLGRGGSDYSATLLAAMLKAENAEIWSDVAGILTADPTLVPEAKRIRSMTFGEAAELAYFGAKVLHPATLLPAIENGIPVDVLNSRRPAESGTRVGGQNGGKARDGCIVKSIAYKEGIAVVTVTSTRMLMAYGFLASIFEVFNRHQTAIDLVSTSEVSVSMTIDNTENIDVIERELRRYAQVDIQRERAIVCLVGEKMRQTPGMPAKIFGALEDFEIHLISQGASEINISFVVDEIELPRVITRLHEKFFSGPLDENVFVVD